MKTHIFYNLDANARAHEAPNKYINHLSEEVKRDIHANFQALLRNPENIKLIRDAINNITDYTRRIRLTMMLNCILTLQRKIESIHKTTYARLKDLMRAINSKIPA